MQANALSPHLSVRRDGECWPKGVRVVRRQGAELGHHVLRQGARLERTALLAVTTEQPNRAP